MRSPRVWQTFIRQPSVILCSTVLAAWICVALLPKLFLELREIPIDLPKTRMAPVFSMNDPLGWFGYDSVGGSVFLQVINGAGVSLAVGLTTVLLCLLLGLPLGALAALKRGWVDVCISRVMDILLSFPPLVLPIALTTLLGGGLVNTVLALSIVGWVGSAKLIRGEFLALQKREFVEAARALGASGLRIVLIHLLPHAAAPLLIHATLSLSGVILAEAGLSFLGVGLGEDFISWGTLLSEARAYLLESPHLAIFPSLALLSVVLCLNFLAEHLRRAMDPKA